jgi:hypothetical protein
MVDEGEAEQAKNKGKGKTKAKDEVKSPIDKGMFRRSHPGLSLI